MTRIIAGIDRAMEYATIAIFAAMICVGTAQVFNRYFLNASLSWSEEFQRYGQIWLVFLAVPIAYRRGMHMGIEGLRKYLGRNGRIWFVRLIDVLWLGLGSCIALGTYGFMDVLSTQRSAGLNLPMHWVYAGILIGALYMILIGLRRLGASIGGHEIDAADGRD